MFINDLGLLQDLPSKPPSLGGSSFHFILAPSFNNNFYVRALEQGLLEAPGGMYWLPCGGGVFFPFSCLLTDAHKLEIFVFLGTQ